MSGGSMGLRVKFWGVRGSIACPSPDHILFGGNTACIEVEVNNRVFIIDAGTGVRLLGRDLIRRGVKQAHMLLTHTHMDHINGFPFFAPAFDPSFQLHLWSGHLPPDRGGIRSVLDTQMDNPTFPVPLSAMRGCVGFTDFMAGDTLSFTGDVCIETRLLRHPNGATGYRISGGGATICTVFDTEHVPGQLDRDVLALIRDADLVIYDCTYTEDEFPSKIGWGHSTWEQGIALCQAAGAKKLAIFHHEPDHDDQFMASLERQAQAVWDGAFAAREGMELIF